MGETIAPPAPEVEFHFEGQDYVMVFDWGALAFYERTMSESIFAVFAELERYQVAADAKVPNIERYAPRMSAVGALVKAGLHHHHPAISFDTAMRMFSDPAVQAALGSASDASMGGGEGAAGKPMPAPQKARATRKRASTGTKPSPAGSKPAARSKNSGARRRV